MIANQIPVVTGDKLLGVFSYRSFAEGVERVSQKERNICELPVKAFCNDLNFATIFDELVALIDEFELKDAVLIGSENELLGIATTIDTLRYFYEVASVYVMLGEIELAIGELMRASMNEFKLKESTDICLRKHYEEKSMHLPVFSRRNEFEEGDRGGEYR